MIYPIYSVIVKIIFGEGEVNKGRTDLYFHISIHKNAICFCYTLNLLFYLYKAEEEPGQVQRQEHHHYHRHYLHRNKTFKIRRRHCVIPPPYVFLHFTKKKLLLTFPDFWLLITFSKIQFTSSHITFRTPSTKNKVDLFPFIKKIFFQTLPEIIFRYQYFSDVGRKISHVREVYRYISFLSLCLSVIQFVSNYVFLFGCLSLFTSFSLSLFMNSLSFFIILFLDTSRQKIPGLVWYLCK